MAKLKGSHVMVTGGTGSFGRQVAVRLQDRNPASITVLSRDEKKQHDMRRIHPDFRYVLGDVRDFDTTRSAMKGVDIVFHAAALKQVPSCEIWPMQAVMTNVQGSANVFRAAAQAGVDTVIALSTDKAVKPVNAMGMSKALMEKLLLQYSREETDTVYAAVRYGNVLGTRGSVVPLFQKQLEEGRPLTITVPEMTRFLLTLDEAIGLVFYAMEQAKSGETLVRKAPACTVKTLAEAVARRQGRMDVPVESIGMRVGEKMHEVLVNEYEMLRARETDAYYVLPAPSDGTEVAPSHGGTEYTSANTRRLTEPADVAVLLAAAEGAGD